METAGTGKVLGEAALVGGTQSGDDLLQGDTALGEGTVVSSGEEDYFASARLNRQQARDSALSLLQKAANDDKADQSVKDEANETIQTMASVTVCEAQIENLITAKGYRDCVAFIGDESISVVISPVEGGMTTADTAKIMDIVTSETEFTAGQVKIMEAH